MTIEQIRSSHPSWNWVHTRQRGAEYTGQKGDDVICVYPLVNLIEGREHEVLWRVTENAILDSLYDDWAARQAGII